MPRPCGLLLLALWPCEAARRGGSVSPAEASQTELDVSWEGEGLDAGAVSPCVRRRTRCEEAPASEWGAAGLKRAKDPAAGVSQDEAARFIEYLGGVGRLRDMLERMDSVGLETMLKEEQQQQKQQLAEQQQQQAQTQPQQQETEEVSLSDGEEEIVFEEADAFETQAFAASPHFTPSFGEYIDSIFTDVPDHSGAEEWHVAPSTLVGERDMDEILEEARRVASEPPAQRPARGVAGVPRLPAPPPPAPAPPSGSGTKRSKRRKKARKKEEEEEELSESEELRLMWKHECSLLKHHMRSAKRLSERIGHLGAQLEIRHPSVKQAEVFSLFAKEMISDPELLPEFLEWFESPDATRYLIEEFDGSLGKIRKMKTFVRSAVELMPRRGPSGAPSTRAAVTMEEAFQDYLQRSGSRATGPVEVTLAGVRLSLKPTTRAFKTATKIDTWRMDERGSELRPSAAFDFAFPIGVDAALARHADLAAQALAKASKLVGNCRGQSGFRELRVRMKRVGGRRSLEVRFIGSEEKFPVLQPWIDMPSFGEVLFFAIQQREVSDRQSDMVDVLQGVQDVANVNRAFRITMFGDFPFLIIYGVNILDRDLIGFHPECLATLDANLLERYANMTLQKRAVETVTSDDDSAVSLLE